MLIMLTRNPWSTFKYVCLVTLLSVSTITYCTAKTFRDDSQGKNNITVTVHPLTNAEMRNLFNCYNPIKIVRLTSYYQALSITVENRTAQEYVLEQKNIDLKLENNLVIKRKVTTNPILIPLITGVGTTALLIAGIGFAVLPSIIAGTALGVTTLNLNMQQSNRFSIKNIRNQVLDAQHPTLITSFSKTQKIIFVKTSNMKKNIAVTLESLDLQKKEVFNFTL